MSLAHAHVPAPGLRDVTPLPAHAHRHPANTAHDELRARFLRAGREAVDDRELLQLMLAGSHSAAEAERLATILLDTFGTPSRVLAARTDALRTVAGLGEAGIAAVKTAEALGIAMARAALPETFHPQLATYDKVVEYCRALAAHRDVEEFRALYLNTKNRLLRDELLQTGTVNHTPVYPRQVCIRALEVGASALVVLHQHPSNDPTPSRADVEMTTRLRDALKTIGVDLHDHIVVAPGDAFSFKQNGLL
ncbi:MAG: DNA repair protein RadC [Rhodospirillales bacterium]|nr:DNA repair protein RadC [Rhodospirillales bacterium]